MCTEPIRMHLSHTGKFSGTAESRRQFEEAMKHGHINVWLVKVIMYGAVGSGKTSSRNLIIGDPSPTVRTSTPLAVRPTTVYRVNMDGEKWSKVTTTEERKTFLAKALIAYDPNLLNQISTTQSEISDLKEDTNSESSVTQESSEDVHDLSNHEQPAAAAEYSSNKPDNILFEVLHSVTTDDELVNLMDEFSAGENDYPLPALRMLQIIDSGGQPQFHEVLPIFLQRLSFYVFVFRLCDKLDHHPKVEFCIDDKPIGSTYTSPYSVEQLVQYCACAIHSNASPNDTLRESAQMVILGTHLDMENECRETREEKNKTILTQLLPILDEKLIYHSLVDKELIFPINAKNPGENEEDIVEKLRHLLSSDSIFPPAAIPFKWFALEIHLEEMIHVLQRGVLRKSECTDAASDKLHFEENELEASLQYLHELSVIFYYPTILPDIVIANPQILLDIITEFVMLSNEIDKLSKQCALSGEMRKFYEFAFVTIGFLSQEAFTKHYVPGLFGAKEVVELFKRLLIFAEFNTSGFIMPALLNVIGKESFEKHRVCTGDLPPFVITFSDGCPPRGVFCSLMCFLVSPDNDSPCPWSIFTDKFNAPLCLYQNCVKFQVSMLPVTIILIDTSVHFEIHLEIQPGTPNDRYLLIAKQITSAIFNGLHKAKLNLQYFSCNPSPALLCPCGRGEAHTATVNLEIHMWICSASQISGVLTPQQLLWFNSIPVGGNTKLVHLTEQHLPDIFSVLKKDASQWRTIGMYLGFRRGELQNIASKPYLFCGAPESYLSDMLSEWLEWAPGDSRGSTQFATLQMLESALCKSGLEVSASVLVLNK